MKEFWCGAVVPDCEAHFQAESDDGILQQVAVHAKEAHDMHEVPASVAEQVRKHIREQD